MDEHSLRVLEFGAVAALAAARAPSGLGRGLVLGSRPTGNREAALRLLRSTSQMRTLLAGGKAPSWAGSADVTGHLDGLRAEGSWIEGAHLVAVADFAGACGRVAAAVRAAGGLDELERLAAGIPELGELEREVRRRLTPEGAVRDDASPELLGLRRGIARTRREIVSSLERLMAEGAAAGAVQEPIVTIREERYVIPVRSGGRGAVPGIVHDRSASGQTLFVEPQAAVEMNNLLREQVLGEREETLRILRALCSRVRGAGDELRSATAAMAALEAAWARAAYAEERGMVEPELLEEPGRLALRGARHPLLLEALGEGGTIPFDLDAGGTVRTLVVTGPNTGGKTAVLKSAGLLALMAQSGLHVPAAAGTALSCFGDVLADIGDEQSIAQSLSTFSGHLRNVVGILSRSAPGTLVLLDELGAGTDPSEGAALGVAVLEKVQALGAVTIATTHHNAVKVYAATTPGVANAAMEFDESTLGPTFRLLAGIPGRSQALAIAERLGLDPEVVARARAERTVGEERFDRLMGQLERERALAAAEREAAAAERLAAAAERRRFEQEAEAERRRIAATRDRLRDETRSALREAERELRQAVRELREKRGEEAASKVRETAARLEAAARDRLGSPAPPPASHPAAVSPGERVFVQPLQAWGVVEQAGEGSAAVVVGDKRVAVRLEDLTAGSEAPRPAPGSRVRRTAGRGSYSYEVPALASTRLDLRGSRVEEALADLQRFLDAASLGGVTEVEILHGKGTGRLQEAVQAALAKDARVAAFGFAPLEQGGAGVTKVSLAP